MNFFEQELRKVINATTFANAAFIGRACYIPLGNGTVGKLEFFASAIQKQYDAIRLTILNPAAGVCDTNLLRFRDLLGIKKVENRNFPEGIIPYIWEDGRNIDWYVYKPNVTDFRKVGNVISRYFSVFTIKTDFHEKIKA